MSDVNLGIINPGNMGISIAASAQDAGCRVHWASSGRSAQTRERAAQRSLNDVGTIGDLCRTCSVLVSVCPPHAAEDVADAVLHSGYGGIYLDANAIAPARARSIAAKVSHGGARFVDGGIIGGPAWEPGRTILYLSGADAGEVAACFGGALVTRIIGGEPGKASALKTCYAALTKGSTALLCGVVATAHQLGVWDDLLAQWNRSDPEAGAKSVDRVRQVTSKAWRFAGEMEEIASTFDSAGLPGGFHAAAADLYRRIASFKDAPSTPGLSEVIAELTNGTSTNE